MYFFLQIKQVINFVVPKPRYFLNVVSDVVVRVMFKYGGTSDKKLTFIKTLDKIPILVRFKG